MSEALVIYSPIASECAYCLTPSAPTVLPNCDMTTTLRKTNSPSSLSPVTRLTFINWTSGLTALKKLMSENRYQGAWHTTTIDDEHTHVFHPTNGKPTCKLQNTTVVINQSPVSIPLTNAIIGAGGRAIKTAQQINTLLEIENASP